MAAVDLVEIWRGDLLECVHQGHVVVADAGGVVAAWGDPEAVFYPRSSAKLVQALPLVESGAADRHGLTPAHLALACASHQGAAAHTDRVADWLAGIGLAEPDLRCGAHEPGDRAARDGLIAAGERPCQIHNNCSGKHTGFLTLGRHLGGGAEYLEGDHPVQQAVRSAWDEVTDRTADAWGIDGCSAPTPATTLAAMARAMAAYAGAAGRPGLRAAAQLRLTAAMMSHPELVSGEREPCTDLMRAAPGQVAVKGGADGYYVGVLPGRGLGIALKITDGSDRAKSAAMAALLVRLGVLAPDHPTAQRLTRGPLRNWRGIETGQIRIAAGFAA
jgi:L-asparaginase II